MFTLDLRLTLFLLLLAVLSAGLFGAWLAGRLRRPQRSGTPENAPPAQSARLLNDLSHELRTPLATLLTHAEVLHLPNLTQEARDQSIELVRAEGRRMSRLLGLMLDLGRLDTTGELPLRPLDFGQLAREALEQMREALEAHGLAVTEQIDPDLPQVQGDADRLRQVLLNLLDNTIKHCPPGANVRLCVVRAPDGLRCAVCDTGPGIPPQHLARLTERFYRAAPQAVEGSGLGLALAAEILKRHHSRLEITSRTAETEAVAAGFGLRDHAEGTGAGPCALSSHGSCFGFSLRARP